jgi:NADH:ubiquinone oxidoreductase subunit B-like Fe-S oxidoreductase
VDVYVPGCSIRPEAVLDGVLKATESLSDPEAQKRHREFLAKLDSGEIAEDAMLEEVEASDRES